MQASKIDSVSAHVGWEADFLRRVELVERRHGLSFDDPSSGRIEPQQIEMITAAGFDPTDIGPECCRLLELRCGATVSPGSDTEMVLWEVVTQEYLWRFGEGANPLGRSAAGKAAAAVVLGCRGVPYDVHEAVRFWQEAELWSARLARAYTRAERVGRVLESLEDGNPVSGRNRDRAMGDIAQAFRDRWAGSCELARLHFAELTHRPHLRLDDEYLRRMTKVLTRYFGEDRIPPEMRLRTARGFLSWLMSASLNEDGQEEPIVVPQGSRAVVHAPYFVRALERLAGPAAADTDQGADDRAARREERPGLDRTTRVDREVVLMQLDVLDAYEDLTQRDKVMLTVQGMERLVETWIIVRRVVGSDLIPKCLFRRPLLLALDGVARALGLSQAEFRPFCRDYALWSKELVNLSRRAVAREDLSDAERGRLGWYLAARSRIGLLRDFDQFGVAAREGLLELGIELTEDDDITDILGRYQKILREWAQETGRPESSGVFLGEDGRLRLSPRMLRDAYSRTLKLPRLNTLAAEEDAGAPPDKYSEVLDQPSTVPVADGFDRDQEADDPLDALQAVETVQAVQRFARASLEQAKPGSARAIILEDLCSFPRRTLLRELARSHGMAVGGLSAAQARVYEELLVVLKNSSR